MSDNLQQSVLRFGKKLTIYSKEYARILAKWMWKVFKSHRYAIQKRFAQRKFDRMLKEFGAEVYLNAIKEGKSDWAESPSIKERIEILRLTEANVNHFDRLREDLERHYEMQKLQIKKETDSLIKALPDLSSKDQQNS
ncbi:MAG: hypothetical protein ACP5TY_01190 [Thermodesulforhabdaceae bacterium]|jgi:hypothetical protein